MKPSSFDYTIYNFSEKKYRTYRLENIFNDHDYKAFEEFNKYYYPDLIVKPPMAKDRKKFQGEKVCRFCKQQAPIVKFKKTAHLLPQLMGNKNLVHYVECDDCNKRFGGYENSLANFLGVFRTMDKMSGQEGIPIYKSPDKGFRMAFEAGKDIFSIEGPKGMVFNKEENKFILTAPKHTYIPLHVMKCLYKIGYSIIFEEELPDYSPILKILMTEEFDTMLVGGGHLAKVYSFSFPTTFKTPTIFTYQKREEYSHEKLPTKIVAIYFGRFMYQFILPNKKDTFLYQKGIQTAWLLVPPFWNSNKMRLPGKLIDLSSCKPKKGEIDTIDIYLENPLKAE